MAVATDGAGSLNPAEAAPASTSREAVTLAHANQRITLGTAEGGSAPLTVTINWGDSSLLDHGEIIDGQVTGQHTYGAPGTYTVTYTLNDGVSATVFTATVTVPSAMVELTTQTGVVIAGASATFTGQGFATGETVEAALGLTPAVTQRVTADAAGEARVTFSVPSTTPEGVFSVVASGVRSGRVGTATLTVLPLKKTATLTVSAAPNTVEVLFATTLTARIDTLIAGQIEFLADGETLDLLTPDSSGQAVLTTSALGIGSHRITARYAGDTLTNAAISEPVTLTVVKPVFTPAVTLAPGATVVHDQALTFAGSGFAAGEAVTARIVGTDVSTVVVAGADGRVTITLPVTKALTPGVYVVDVSGDYSETPLSQTVTVAKKSTAGTAVPSTGDAPEPGGVFAFSGRGFEPGETVTVALGGTAVTANSVADAAGNVIVNVPLPADLAPGAHTYSVEGSYSGTVAGGGTVDVAKSAVGITVLVGATQVASGAKVNAVAVLSAPASGTVTFYDGSAEVGSASIARGALTSAALDIGPLAAGSHAITAVYAGDSRYLGGRSAAVTVQVARPVTAPEPDPEPEPEPLTLSLVAIPATVNAGEAVSLVSVASQAVPGKVGFWEGEVQIAEAALAGPAALGSVSTLAVGKHAIVARFVPASGSVTAASQPVVVDVIEPTALDQDPRAGVVEATAAAARVAVKTVRVVKGSTVAVPLVLDAAQAADNGKTLTVSWKASKSAVATPTKGKASGTMSATLGSAKNLKVRGLKVGTSTIRVTALGAKTVALTVTVVAGKVAASKVTITGKPATLAVGKSRVLGVKTTPSGATSAVPTWKSSKPSIASVDGTGKVTAKKKGTTTITATINGKKAAFSLKVA
jgi:hypothetical protein